MEQKTFTLYFDNKIIQPTVICFDLMEEEYDGLTKLKEDGELVLCGKEAEITLKAQLTDTSMRAVPEGMERKLSLYVLIRGIPENVRGEYRFEIEKRAKELLCEPVGRFLPWSTYPGVYLQDQPQNKRAVVSIDGELMSRYIYSSHNLKPYLYPLCGAYDKSLIQNEPDDHLHHHGIWWGHDGINQNQVYCEFDKEGRQIHKKFLAFFGGPVFGQLTALIDWTSPDGKKLFQETRTIRVYNLPGSSRYIDLLSRLHATEGEVTFDDTKEGGFPLIRVNEQIAASHTGVITASVEGAGERDLFGKTMDWIDYSGHLRWRDYSTGTDTKKPAGISVFVHPSSSGYPGKWFIRDYGMFTPSNFHFAGGYKMKAGEVLSFQQRVYVHEGNAESARTAERYREYAGIESF